MGQRGFHVDDLVLIEMIGTAVEDGYVVLSRDRQAAERTLKCLLDRVRRLDGKRLVIAGGQVITAYRAGKATSRRLLRTTGKRDLAA